MERSRYTRQSCPRSLRRLTELHKRAMTAVTASTALAFSNPRCARYGRLRGEGRNGLWWGNN